MHFPFRSFVVPFLDDERAPDIDSRHLHIRWRTHVSDVPTGTGAGDGISKSTMSKAEQLGESRSLVA